MKGMCHCGAAGWETAFAPVRATRCNCSFCRRTAVLWVYGTKAEITLWGRTHPYVTGDRTLTFHSCPVCACIIHWIAIADDGAATRVAVNARLAPLAEIAGLDVRWLDGAETWDYVTGPFPPA